MQISLWHIAVALIATSASIGTAWAEDTDASTPPEMVVVTATRIPTPVSQVASSITVITDDEIAAKQEATLPDVLKDVPGLNIVQTGGPGGQTSVFMRGTDSNHTKVLVDGIDVSDPSSPNAAFDFSQFPSQDIQRVEVLRGPQSGLYGSDAIGGVINIITKNGSGPAQFTASAEGGSFDTFNQAGGVSGSIDQFNYAVNVEHIQSGATPVTPVDLLASGEKRNDDYYDNVTGSTKLGYDVTENFDIGLVARDTDTQLRFTGEDFNTFPAIPDAKQSEGDTLQYYTRGTAHLVLFDGLLDQTIGLAYSSDKLTDLSPDGPPTYNSGDRIKLDWQGNVKLSADETLVLGLEHEQDEIQTPIEASTTTNSGYAELRSSFGDSFFNTISVRDDDNDRFGSKATFRLAPTYLVKETGTKLKASIGTGFKAPSLSQLFQNFPAINFFANPNLKPESSLGYDFGIERTLLDDEVQAGVTYFHNDIKNLITDNATFTSYANVGRATTDGVESFVSYRPTDGLTLRADYTFTEANDDILHLELLRRPKNKASLNAAWQVTSKLSFNATVLYVGPWIDGNRDFSIPRLTAPGYVTADLAASYDITDQLTLFGRITNLLDRHYEDPVGYLQPSRGIYAGIKAKL